MQKNIHLTDKNQKKNTTYIYTHNNETNFVNKISLSDLITHNNNNKKYIALRYQLNFTTRLEHIGVV